MEWYCQIFICQCQMLKWVRKMSDELDLPTYFGNVTISEISSNEKRIYGPVQKTLNYINNLSMDVVIELRSGIKFTVPPTRCMTNDKFIIRAGLNLSPFARTEAQRLLSGSNPTVTPELKVLRTALQFQMERNVHQGALLSLDYAISLDELRHCGGSMYHYEMDCVISVLEFQYVPAHPYGENGKRNRMLVSQAILSSKSSFQYSLDIIDNLKKYGDRFINLGGVIYKVTPRQDSSMRDGVYIVSNPAIKSGRDNSESTVKYYSFDDTDTTPILYRTYDDAFASGDVNTQRKYELASVNHANDLLKQQANKDKILHEEEMRRLDLRMKEDEALQERRLADLTNLYEKEKISHELEKIRLKDYYEAKSYQRKDQSEIVKWIPSMIIGIGGVLVAIKALKK